MSTDIGPPGPRAFKAPWSLNLYPTAAEASGSYVSPRRPQSRGVRRVAADPVRSREEAARRARGVLRRYCAANRLNRLGTLTYAPPFCTDPLVLRADVAAFFRRLRDGLGRGPFPYVWVPELHQDRVRFHVHFAVGQFVPRGLIEGAWGRGFVHIKLLGDLPVGSGRLVEARVAARYLSKYIGKTLAAEGEGFRPFGRHRYEVAQGFKPPFERVRGHTAAEVLGLAAIRMGGHPDHVWNSEEDPLWVLPPAVRAQWNR